MDLKNNVHYPSKLRDKKTKQLPLSQRFCRIRGVVHADSTLKGSPSFAALKQNPHVGFISFKKTPKLKGINWI